ncbi:MAG: protein jag [Ruminococcaceae bacterium]|nr:protein jag [Oscillospiraceae bacterium]
MKTEITVLGKTVEEAVLKAVEELGAPSAEAITYTVLEEPKKGFLGIGAVPAKIIAVYQKKGADIALDFIKTLVREMELDATVTMEDGEDDNKLIRVDGESAGVLIGHHGDTLDSLQYLANLAANKKVAGEKREYCRVTVDVENYRAKREETLRELARKKAAQVLRYKKSVMLEPMNPYERRIIHSEVQHIEGVSTNSIGSENNRKVVMYLDTETKAEAAKQSRDEYSEF